MERRRVSRVRFTARNISGERGETSEWDSAQRGAVAMAGFSRAIDSSSDKKRFEFNGQVCGLRSSASPSKVAQRGLQSFYAATLGGKGQLSPGVKLLGQSS